MARYRKVDPRIWNDQKFNELSDHGKLAFFFLLTHPHMTALGAMRASIPGMAAELGWDEEAFREAFQEAQRKAMVKHDKKASFVWLPKFLKYNKPESPNVVKAWGDAYDLLPECPLKIQLSQQIKDFVQGLSKGFHEALPEAFAKTSLNQEQEQEQEQDKTVPSPDGDSSSSRDENASASPEPAKRKTENEAANNGKKRSRQTPCPQEKILKAYHEILPELPVVQSWSGASRKNLQTRWREDSTRQNLDWWRWFFREYVRKSDFLMGRVNDFRADMDWIVRPSNFQKILNGRYQNRGPNTGSKLTDKNVRVAQQWASEGLQ
jgi:hypothetical protein